MTLNFTNRKQLLLLRYGQMNDRVQNPGISEVAA